MRTLPLQMTARSLMVPAALAAGVLLAGCSGGGGTTGGVSGTPTSSASSAQSSAASTGTSSASSSSGRFTTSSSGRATAQSSASAAGGVGQAGAQKAVLKLSGTPGVAFSGRCAAGDKAGTFNGKTPARYTYDLGGQGIACQIHKQSPGGVLEITFDAGNSHTTQQVNAARSTLRLAYNGGRLSVSQSSKTP
jgi:hypothetical protein